MIETADGETAGESSDESHSREAGDEASESIPATQQDAVDLPFERHGSTHDAYAHLLTRFKQGNQAGDSDATLAAMSDMKQRYPEVRADE